MKRQDNKLKKNLATLGLGVMMSFGVAGLAACGETPMQYKVSFDTDGGTTYNQITANGGDKINLPTPEREGYVFGGWFLNEECSGEAVTGLYTVTAETTLYAKWTAIQGTVTFESNGGTAYNPVTVNGQLVLLPTPEKTDYVFGGWYLTADFSGDAISGKYAPTGNVTLYAKWTYSHIVVSFNSNGATTHDNLTYKGEAIALPTPFKYGYAFEGWFDNADCTGEAVSSTAYEPSADITLYAKWSKVTYVYMYYNDNQDYKRFEYKAGDTITVDALEEKFTPAAITVQDTFGKEYSAPFAYWMHEGATEDTHTQVTAPITVGDEHIILIAKYDMSKVPPKVNMTYDADADAYTTTGRAEYVFFDKGTAYGTYSMTLSFLKGASGGIGATFRMTAPSKDNQYETAGASNFLSTCIVPGDAELGVYKVTDGKWARIVSDVVPTGNWKTYYDGLNSGDRITLTMKVVVTKDGFKTTLSNFGSYTDEQVIFDKTYAELGLNVADYPATGFGLRSSSTGAIISNLSYVPVYEVELDQAYGEDETKFVAYDKINEVVAEDSDVLFDDENDKNTAYYNKFVGWSLTEGGELVETLTSNDKLFAVYEKVNLHTITFDAANGEKTYVYVEDGEGLVLPTEDPFKNGEEVDGTLKGYTFNEWQVNGVAAVAGTPITADITVIATYNVHNAYTVSFEAEGVTVEDVVVAEGETVNLPAPERENYRFDGWFTDITLENAYANTGVNANVTLYGKWVEQVVVTFISNGSIISTKTIDKGATVTLPENPTKAEETKTNGNILTYTFSKWTANSAEVTAATVFNSSTTVEAEFACVETRNGAVVTRDPQGKVESYKFSGDRSVQRGIIFDELTMTESGEIEYNVNVKKWDNTDATMYIDFIYLVENPTAILNYTGADGQDAAFVRLNLTTATLTFNARVANASYQNHQLSFGQVKDCQFKTDFTNYKDKGAELNLNVRIAYAKKADGEPLVKVYLSNCLIYACGFSAEDLAAAGETCYGTSAIGYSNVASPTEKQKAEYDYLENPLGYGAGVWLWEDISQHESITVSNIKYTPIYRVNRVVDGATRIECVKSLSDVTAAKDSDVLFRTAGDNNTAYYKKFVGWSLTEGGAKIDSISQDCTLYPVYEEVELHTVTYTADGAENVYVYVKDGDTVAELAGDPQVEGKYLAGWYTDSTFETVFSTSTVISKDTIVYGKLMDALAITFVAEGKTVETIYIASNSTIAELPTATKASSTKANGNVLSYNLKGWYDGDTKVTTSTVFTESKTLIADFTETEKRGPFIVKSDANGIVYDSTTNNHSTAATNQGVWFDGFESDLENGSEYKLTLTVNKIQIGTNSNCNIRIGFFLNPADQGVHITGSNNQSTVFVNFATNTGTLIFGSKTGKNVNSTFNAASPADKSANHYVMDIGGTDVEDIDAESNYAKYYKSLKKDDKAVFTIRVQHGIKNGQPWVKYYMGGGEFGESLIFTYGLTEDSEGSGTVDGEKPAALICDDTNHNSSAANYNFLVEYFNGTNATNNATYGAIGNKVGIWSWGGEKVNGAYTVSNISNNSLKANS